MRSVPGRGGRPKAAGGLQQQQQQQQQQKQVCLVSTEVLETCLSCPFSSFPQLLLDEVRSWKQKKRLLKVLQEDREAFAAIDMKLLTSISGDAILSTHERNLYEAHSGDSEEKISFLQLQCKQMAEQGLLSRGEKEEVLASLRSKIVLLQQQWLGGGDVNALAVQISLLEAREKSVLQTTLRTPRLKHFEKLLQCRLRLLVLKEQAQCLASALAIAIQAEGGVAGPPGAASSEEKRLEIEIASLETSSRGWFELEAEFVERASFEVDMAKSLFSSKRKELIACMGGPGKLQQLIQQQQHQQQRQQQQQQQQQARVINKFANHSVESGKSANSIKGGGGGIGGAGGAMLSNLGCSSRMGGVLHARDGYATVRVCDLTVLMPDEESPTPSPPYMPFLPSSQKATAQHSAGVVPPTSELGTITVDLFPIPIFYSFKREDEAAPSQAEKDKEEDCEKKKKGEFKRRLPQCRYLKELAIANKYQLLVKKLASTNALVTLFY